MYGSLSNVVNSSLFGIFVRLFRFPVCDIRFLLRGLSFPSSSVARSQRILISALGSRLHCFEVWSTHIVSSRKLQSKLQLPFRSSAVDSDGALFASITLDCA